MKLKTQFIIICREAFLEAGTNNLNLIRIFSGVQAGRFPFVLPNFALVVNFDVDEAGAHTLRTTVSGPDGTTVANTELPVNTNAGNWQVIANFEHLQAPLPGPYTFHLTLDTLPLGSKTLQVNPARTRVNAETAVA
jgi:hypothetical protein